MTNPSEMDRGREREMERVGESRRKGVERGEGLMAFLLPFLVSLCNADDALAFDRAALVHPQQSDLELVF